MAKRSANRRVGDEKSRVCTLGERALAMLAPAHFFLGRSLAGGEYPVHYASIGSVSTRLPTASNLILEHSCRYPEFRVWRNLY